MTTSTAQRAPFGLTPQMMSLDSDAFVTLLLAVHEHGHARMAEDLGYTVASISVFPTPRGFSGRTVLAETRMRDDDRVLYALAGPAAEWLLLRELQEHGLDPELYRHLCHTSISSGDRALLERSLASSSFADQADAFAAACRWAERRRDSVRIRAEFLLRELPWMRGRVRWPLAA